ncbi:MAG: beta-ketoacyl synthase N-terminal-like domain-containing protein [Prevotella sp.]
MIVITGVGTVSAIGNNKAETLLALKESRSGIAMPRYLDSIHRDLPVGEVKLSNAELAAMTGEDSGAGRAVLIGIKALDEALDEAALKDGDLSETAFISGTTVGLMDIHEQAYGLNRDASSIGDCQQCSEAIARHFGQFAQVSTCSTACSSAANAFILGANMIRCGMFKRVVVGGTECLTRFHLNGFNTLMILDHEPCRPFSADRAGLNLGEGAAYFVLETEESAAQRGVSAVAKLTGWGNACDAFHQTATSDDGIGPFLSMQKALAMAGLVPADIDYINAHGTGTQNNDITESRAISRLFGETLPYISSTKAMTGHATSSSGAIEIAFCILALQHNLIPANLRFAKSDADCIVPVGTTITNISLQHVLCNSFGFGGNDTSIVLSRSEVSGEKSDEREVRNEGCEVLSIVDFSEIAEEEKPKIPPLVARRLSGVLRRALITSIVAMERAGVRKPDAIVTGTALGCIEETKAFLDDIYDNGEQLLKPTNFINSTHNTIGSLIATRTGNHGYNSTYSSGCHSLDDALLDAWLQIQTGDIETALVGCHDEAGEFARAVVLRAGGDIKSFEQLKRTCNHG